MLRYAADLIDIDKLRADHEIVFEILFNSKRKWNLMITKQVDRASRRPNMSNHLPTHDENSGASHDDVDLLLMMKGAAEILIEMCTTIATEKGEVNLDQQQKQAFLVKFSPLLTIKSRS